MAIIRKDEVLGKAVAGDTNIVPRYTLITAEGTIIAEYVELQLVNPILQEGMLYDKDFANEALAASGPVWGDLINGFTLEQPNFELDYHGGTTIRAFFYNTVETDIYNPIMLDVANSGTAPLVTIDGEPLTKIYGETWVTAIFIAGDSGPKWVVQGAQYKVAEASQASLAAKASTLAQRGGEGPAMTFNWNRVEGMPAYVWGGENPGTSIYVYDPRRFDVNSATFWGAGKFNNTASAPKRYLLSSDGGNPAQFYMVDIPKYFALRDYTNTFGQPNYFDSILQANHMFYLQNDYSRSGGRIDFGSVGSGGKIRCGPSNTQDGANFSMANGWFNFRNQNESMWGTLNCKEVKTNSDKRLKKSIKDIPDTLAEKIMKLRPVSFQYRQDDTKGYGFIAQEVQEVFPEFVAPSDPSNPESTLSLGYNNFIGLLTMMAQRHEAALAEKDKEVQDVRSRLEKLEKLVEGLL